MKKKGKGKKDFKSKKFKEQTSHTRQKSLLTGKQEFLNESDRSAQFSSLGDLQSRDPDLWLQYIQLNTSVPQTWRHLHVMNAPI